MTQLLMATRWGLGRRAREWSIVIGGAVVLQLLLCGSSLLGRAILLPVGILAQKQIYLPPSSAPPREIGQSYVFSDCVLNYEFSRRFAAAEVRAGRVPLWDPYSFAGVPFAHYGKYSPLNWPSYLIPGPTALAYSHLLRCLVATTGAFVFFRRVLGVRFWPATIGAWCYPLTGFLVLWQAAPVGGVVAWYPALLTAVAVAARRPWGVGPAAVALVTALTILAGHADVGAQVIAASGLFGVWCVARVFRTAGRVQARRGALALAIGWGVGLAASAPYLLPLLEYAKSGQRMSLRAEGKEERPPGEFADAFLFVVPDWAGTSQAGSLYFGKSNQIEGPATAYAGLLAALVAAPLAWLSRPHRRLNWFWVGSGSLGAAWVLGVPLVVDALRAPGLNMVSHNRFTFVTGFAVLALAVTGLNRAWGGRVPRWYRGYLVPVGLLFVLALAARNRWADLPPEAEKMLAQVPQEAAGPIRESLGTIYPTAILICAAGVGAWVLIATGRSGRVWSRLVAVGMVLELLCWGRGYDLQSDPELYYPPLPAVERVRAAGDGRGTAVFCLPADLTQILGVRDIRGYDGVDPKPILEVLDRARSRSDRSPSYARTQAFVPVAFPRSPSPGPAPDAARPGGPRFHPVLAMLNVRWVIFLQGVLPTKEPPAWAEGGYEVYENEGAVPRAFVPTRVETRADEAAVLNAIADRAFEPARIAYVTESIAVPPECSGTATVSEPKPTEVVVSAEMRTDGLLVLADQWAEGWTAELDGVRAPIVRVDHALRGVVVPTGAHTVVFRYWPPGLTTGLWLALSGVLVLAGWYGPGRRLARRAPRRGRA